MAIVLRPHMGRGMTTPGERGIDMLDLNPFERSEPPAGAAFVSCRPELLMRRAAEPAWVR